MTEDPSTDNVGEPDQDKAAAAEPEGVPEAKAAAAEITAVGAEITAVRAEPTSAAAETTAVGADGEQAEGAREAQPRDGSDDDDLDVDSLDDLDVDVDDASDGLELAGLKAAQESADDSLDAILLQAGARPLEPASDKSLGSRTLMGIGIEGLNLASLRPDVAVRPEARSDAESPDDDLEGTAAGLRGTPDGGSSTGSSTSDANTPALVESKLTASLSDDDKKSTSLLDEVAQALNAQAAGYRDKARGRLPGMPGSTDVATGGGRGASSDAEFEDPDDAQPSSVTPSIISVVDDHDAIALDSPDQARNKAPVAGTPGMAAGARPSDGRPTIKVPPVPGLSAVPASSPVGPPPGGAARPTTPMGGLPLTTSGRVRLPTPGPNSVLGLPSPSGRVTLPPGTMSPFAAGSGPVAVSPDLTATMPSTPNAKEASRRNSGGMTMLGQGSGRVVARANSRVTEPVVRPAPFVLPAVLTAHVKMATLNLAGLIALTFAGGLFVGMLVWRGQTIQGVQGTTARSEPTVAPRPGTPDPTATAPSGAAVAQPAVSAAIVPVGGGTPVSAGTPASAAGTPGVAPADPVVAPLPPPTPVTEQASAEVAAPEAPPHKVIPAAARTIRPKRPAAVVAPAAFVPPSAPATATAPTVAKATPPKAAAQTVSKPVATNTAPKPVATNTAPKPVAKAKAKPVWRDPFAD